MGYMDFVRPISAILFFFVARNISMVEIPKLKFAAWVALVYIIITFAAYISLVLGSIVTLSLIVLMLYVNGIKVVHCIIIALVAMIIMIISNVTSQIILSSTLYKDIDFYKLLPNDSRLFVRVLALNYLFSHAISKCLRLFIYKKFKIRATEYVNWKVQMSFFVITLMVFFYIYFSALMGSFWENPAVLIIYIVFFIFLIIYSYFILTSTMKEERLKKSKKELRQLEKYTANIESMYNDIRSIRHDYANVISSMAGYMDDKDMDGLSAYFKNEIIPFADRMETADNNLSVLARLKQPSLKGIMTVKLILAYENNISILVDIKDDINIKSIEILDLNRIVGILLDNAVEAVMECDRPTINIGFINYKDTITIVVINCLKDENINMGQMFEQGFSTKGSERGFGLNNITKILEQYPNVILETVVENKNFKQVLHIEEIGEEKQC